MFMCKDHSIRIRSTLLILLVPLTAVFVLSGWARAQVGGMPGEDLEYANNDYFQASDDPNLYELLMNVERNHLGKKFWKYYGGRELRELKYALGDLQYTLNIFPNHPQALLLVESIGKMTKVPSIAVPYYERALLLFPQYAVTHAQYGKYLRDIGELDKGITELKEAIKLDPELALAHGWLAEAYFKKGNQDLGRIAAERARALGYKEKPVSGFQERKQKQ